MDQRFLQVQDLPDAVLISSIIAGEKKLFEWIIRRYNQKLFRIGMSILNDEAATEDAMQSAYISAYEHLAAFQNRSSFGTWLTRIMLNECLAQKKKSKRIKIEMETHAQDNNNKMTPASLLANKELNTVLEAAVAQLPEKYRLVFVLREIEEMSVKETSEVLNIEQPNVKVRLNRAKAMLREGLSGYIKDHVYGFHLSKCDRMVTNVLTHIGIQ